MHSIGSRLIHLSSTDTHKAFGVLFRTTPFNDTGVAHCLEHIALCGSHRYPVRDPFMKMLSRSLNSYMNAWTGPDFTMYPFSTKNSKDFSNLLSVYLDASFFPLLKYEDFLQEAWRFELEEGKLVYKGVVFNEMKGKASDPSEVMIKTLMKELMPGTTYECYSAGDPRAIPQLKYEDLKKFHSDFYHPSNATFLMYGDMDAKQVMQEIEEKALKHFQFNPIDTRVKISKKLDRPHIIQLKIPADPVDTDPEKPCKYSMSFLCDEIDEKDPFQTFLMTVLSTALFNNQNSPMYKALLESRIGTRYFDATGFDNSTRQASFTIGLDGVAIGSEQLIEDTIKKTLQDVAERGFDDLLIESSLHQIEIRTKQVTSNYGLSLISSILSHALHGSDPLVPLYINKYVEKLRKMLETRQPVFQELIKKHLLANTHCVRIMAVPEQEFVGSLEAKEEQELQEIEEKMDKETEERIKKETKMLLEAQGKEENLDVLPTLLVSDIAKTIKYTEYESQFTIEGVKVNYIIEPTNGISYVRVKSNVKDLPEDLKPLFPLYRRLINSLGTQKNPYNEFDTIKDLYTISGISSAILTPSFPTSLAAHQELFLMKFAALDRNLAKAFEIFQEFLMFLRFDEYDHIQNLIKRSVKSRTDDLLDSGTSYGSGIASASLTQSAACYESLKTLQQDCSLFSQIQKSSSTLQSLKPKLEAIHNFVLNKNSIEFVVHTSDPANKERINSQIQSLISSLTAKTPEFSQPRTKILTTPFTKSLVQSYYSLPIQVNYVAEAFLGTCYTSEDYPALKVLTEIMTMKALLKEVREKGGAYGASASVDSLRGTIVLSSFRDPNNLKTFAAFQKVIKAMVDGKFTERDIDEGKLGVFGRLDKPVDVHDKGLYSFLNNLNVEQLRRHRELLLSVSKDEIVKVARKYLQDQAGESSKIIFGPENPDIPGWIFYLMGCGIIQKKYPRTARGSIILFPGQFVQNLPESIYTYYEIKDSLGSGSYGTVVSAIHKTLREPRAIKIINKFKLQSEESRKKVINEVLILRKLDHPHIIKIFEFYEDEFNLYVVMELCRGGELLDTIIKKKSISEVDASMFMKHILSAVFYMHSQGIVHRDLKLENMLLDSSTSKNLKIVDFGTACELEPDKKLSQVIGTVNYMAPEVFKRNYTEKCDIWSCGVILYILLSGKLPFSGKDKKHTMALIQRGVYSMESAEWAGISSQAKEFIGQMMEVNVNKRLTAEEAFNSQWLQLAKPPEVNPQLLQKTVQNLANFGETSKFQRAVIRYIVSQLLNQSEKTELINIFKSFDVSGHGKINQKEFVDYCKQVFGNTLTEEEILSIMTRIDTDKSGFIDYSEFLAAALDRSKLLSLERLETAFGAFDKDGNGKISAHELKTVLELNNNLDIEAYQRLINEVDQNNDEMVDFKEFKDMMNKLK